MIVKYTLILTGDIDPEHYEDLFEEWGLPDTEEGLLEAERRLCKEDGGYLHDVIVDAHMENFTIEKA